MNKKMTKKQIQGANTKNKLYDAAVELLEKKGFENMRIENICQLAGVAVGSFYTHFNSKNDILVEIFKRADDYFKEEVTQSLVQENLVDRILEYFDFYAKYNESLGVETIRHLYTFDNKMFINEGRYMQILLYEIVSQAQANGAISHQVDYKLISKELFIVARGVVYDWCLYDGEYNIRETLNNLIRRMLSTYQ